jgi:hypothetical protein
MGDQNLIRQQISINEEFDKVYREMIKIITESSSQIFGQREIKDVRKKFKTSRIR